jgi:hypothetical protein
VQPHGVVLGAGAVEFAIKLAGVTDAFQVWPLALDVGEQRLDPGLVGWGRRPPEPLHDRAGCHELAGGVRAHLWAVVAHRQQHRQPAVVEVVHAGLPGSQRNE